MRGLTLIELIVVIAIIAIISTLATVNIQWWMRDSRLNEIRDVIMADLEDIKLKSVTGVPHGIRFEGSKNYSIIVLEDLDGDFIKDLNEPVKVFNNPNPSLFPLPSNYIIKWGNTQELWFDRKGRPRNADWGLGMGSIKICYDESRDNKCCDPKERECNPPEDKEAETLKTIVISREGRIQYEKK